MTGVEGTVAAGFEPVAEAFTQVVGRDQAAGASLAVYQDGQLAVDLAGGTADPATGAAFTRGTPVVAFSCGKGLLTICAYLLVQDGVLDLDAPVAAYWPGFAAHGKDGITTRLLLSHRAGLPMTPPGLRLADLYDWAAIMRAYEQAAPLWRPGETHGYHTLSVGWLAGAVLLAVSGRTPGQLLAERVARPLGVNARIGTAEHDQRLLASLVTEDPVPASQASAADDGLTWDEITVASLFPAGLVAGFAAADHAATLAVEIPAANLTADARALARIYAACVGEVGGVRLLAPASVADASREQSSGTPWRAATPAGYRWGTGFMLDCPMRPMLSPASFGHDGAAGSLGFADKRAAVGFGFVTNRISADSYRRADALVAALRRCVAPRKEPV